MKAVTPPFIAGCLVIAASLWLAGYLHYAVGLSAMASQKERLSYDQKTDAIIVLTGGPDRINTGLDMLAGGVAPRLFISGVNRNVTLEKLLALWNHDITDVPCCVILGHEARNTNENAREARDWVMNNDIDTIRLVTADYHMKRALVEFRHALPELSVIPYPVISNRKRPFMLLLNEYNKMLFAWLRWRITQQN